METNDINKDIIGKNCLCYMLGANKWSNPQPLKEKQLRK